MLAKGGKFFIVSALVLLIGGQWALLQSVAWVGMAIDNSRTLPIKQALSKTFDGKHPCTLCKLVAQGKKTQKRDQTQTPDSKLDLLFMSNLLEIKLLDYPRINPQPSLWPSRPESPPTPPPLAV